MPTITDEKRYIFFTDLMLLWSQTAQMTRFKQDRQALPSKEPPAQTGPENREGKCGAARP